MQVFNSHGCVWRPLVGHMSKLSMAIDNDWAKKIRLLENLTIMFLYTSFQSLVLLYSPELPQACGPPTLAS